MVSPSTKSPDGNSSTSYGGGIGVENPSADAAVENDSGSSVNNQRQSRSQDHLGVSTEEDAGGGGGYQPYISPMGSPSLFAFETRSGAKISGAPGPTGGTDGTGETVPQAPLNTDGWFVREDGSPVFDPPLPPELLNEVANDPNVVKFEQSYAAIMEMLRTAERIVQSGLLAGVDVAATMTYLRAVGAALNAQREQIQLQGVKDAIIKKELSGAMYDSIVDQAEKRKAELDTIKAQNAAIATQAATGAKISGLMAMLTPLILAASAILTIASFGTLGPLMIAVNVILIGISVADNILEACGEESLTSKVMEALTQAVMDVVKAFGEIAGTAGFISKEDAAIIAAAVMVAMVVLVAVVSAAAAAKFAGTAIRLGTAAMSGARALLQSTAMVMSHTGIVGQITERLVYIGIMNNQEPAKDEAGRKTQEEDAMRIAKMTGLIVNAAFSIGVGFAAARSVSQSARAMDRFSKSMETLRTWLYRGQVFLSLANAGLGGFQSHIQATIYDMNGALAMIKANADAYDEKAEDAIETYKATLKILQKALNPLAALAEDIERLQVKKYRDLRDIPFIC